MFRTRTDADITLGIYRRHPVLIRDDAPDGNPWGLTFGTLFHMANDSALFRTPDDLAGAAFNGWSYTQGETEYLPLYEAKMLGHFDHRFSTYRDATQDQLNIGALPRPRNEQHDDPDMEVLSRYWVQRPSVKEALNREWDRGWLFGWRKIRRASDLRTFVPFVLPLAPAGDSCLLAFPAKPDTACVLAAVTSAMVFDYLARQKLAGTNMQYFIVKQLACPTPETFAQAATWHSDCTIADWLIPYVLESYTSWWLKPYAEEMGDDGPPFRRDPQRRALLRADLDAAMLHVYGLNRGESEHVLDSFPVVRKYDERDHGEYQTKRLVLDAYDRMASAAACGGVGWEPLADPPPGSGRVILANDVNRGGSVPARHRAGRLGSADPN